MYAIQDNTKNNPYAPYHEAVVRACVRAVVRACVRAVVRACVRVCNTKHKKLGGDPDNPTNCSANVQQTVTQADVLERQIQST